METFFLHLLAKPVLLNVNVAKARLQARSVLGQEANGLLVIAKDCRTVAGAKLEVLEEPLPAI